MATRRWRWWGALTGVVALGLLIRLLHVLAVLRHVPLGFDAVWYTLQGGSIREGHGFVDPTSLFTGPLRPTAGFPPGYPAYQAAWQQLFGAGPTSVRLAGLIPATATIGLSGVIGRRALGPAAGLGVAGVVAVDPSLVSVDGSSMSENLTVALVLAVVAVALAIVARDRHPDHRQPMRLVLLGVLCGVATLTRQDLILLVPLVGIAVSRPSWRGVGDAGGPASPCRSSWS